MVRGGERNFAVEHVPDGVGKFLDTDHLVRRVTGLGLLVRRESAPRLADDISGVQRRVDMPLLGVHAAQPSREDLFDFLDCE